MGWLSGILPGPEDAFGLGLVLVLIGVFLLANSILFRHPRTLVAEHFGAARGRLVSIRGLIFQRLQVHLGSLFLLVGLALQIYGHYGLEPGLAGTPREFPLAWVGVIVVAVAVLELGGWWLSHALFLRIVRAHFQAHPPALEGDLALARELGALFGIHGQGDDSVQSYLARIRRRIGLPEHPRAAALRLHGELHPEPEEGFG